MSKHECRHSSFFRHWSLVIHSSFCVDRCSDPHPAQIFARRKESSVSSMDVTALTSALKDEAHRLGFALAGACPAVTPQGIHQFHAWLEAGYAGEMTYLPGRRGAYKHPRHVLDGVRSLLMLAIPYRTSEPAAAAAGQGRVSRYAWG